VVTLLYDSRDTHGSWRPASLSDDRRYRPDWAAIQQGRLSNAAASKAGRSLYVNICPGDTKLSTKWKSSWNFSVERSLIKEFKKPVAQIFNYCVDANARYGYIFNSGGAIGCSSY
jgi:hypothetical protein